MCPLHVLLIMLFINIILNFSFLGILNFSAQRFDPMQLNPDLKVKKVSTPISEKELAKALCDSHMERYGSLPNKNKLAVAWAHVGLENGRGKKVWNNNLGNQGPFTMQQKYYHHLKRGWPYRSFNDFNESASSYWRIIEKCSMAGSAFSMGNPDAASQSLKRCNYYSSSAEDYTRSLTSLYYEAVSKKLSCD